MKNKDLKLSLIFTFIGLLAGFVTCLYQISTFDNTMKETIVDQLGSVNALIPISAVQTGILVFISSFFGLKLARKSNLHLNFKFCKKGLLLAIVLGFITAFIISWSDKFIFAKYLPIQAQSYKFSITYFTSSILYGGIVEELMLRLFIMSLIVVLIKKLFIKTKDNIPNLVYITAIIISALLFAIGHLPATAQLIGLSVPIVIRAIVLNGIGGLGFGYLYWKEGLAYSISAHMLTHIFNQLLIMPLLF
jgi:hypothetical protein